MLTTAQLSTLKAAILAETDPTFDALRATGQTGAMAAWYNEDSAFVVWRNSTKAVDILAAVTWANFTPADAADATALYTNRALLCQLKRDNLWCMLARDSLPTSSASTRTNLSDALQNVPAGVGGALLDGGWLGTGKVKAAISRFATKAEALFTTGTGTSNTPGALVWEGIVSNQNVVDALNGA
jgi:hypothetical protein